jgi:hypothetical protein
LRTNIAGLISMPVVLPASCTCSRKGFENGSAEFPRAATWRKDGNMSRMSSTDLPNSSAAIKDTPVMFPPGRLRLGTKPVPSGSPDIMTIGISLVAFCAASAQGVYTATMTSTLRVTNSAARLGRRSSFSSADRNSKSRFCPST